jgi:hypothetical protein
MAPLGRDLRGGTLALISAGALLSAACSPEARRVRDGGPGADPGNKRLIEAPIANPHAADTTLWPGRALTPVERLVRGTMPPPPPAAPAGVAQPKKQPPEAKKSAFNQSAADPRTGPERR